MSLFWGLYSIGANGRFKAVALLREQLHAVLHSPPQPGPSCVKCQRNPLWHCDYTGTEHDEASRQFTTIDIQQAAHMPCGVQGGKFNLSP